MPKFNDFLLQAMKTTQVDQERAQELMEFMKGVLGQQMIDSFGQRSPQEVVRAIIFGGLEIYRAQHQIAIICFCGRQGWIPMDSRNEVAMEINEVLLWRVQQLLGGVR
ncbi:MAG: hypothetical protein WA057_06685 [Candidatus Magasanikiibacteriota bacterium]